MEGGWPFRFSWPSAFLTLIALSLASIWLHERAQRNAECALAAHTLETKLVSLLIDLGRAESSQRGYLLSGDPRFLPTRRPAIDAVLPEGGAELMLDADPVEIDPDRPWRPACSSPNSSSTRRSMHTRPARDRSGLGCAPSTRIAPSLAWKMAEPTLRTGHRQPPKGSARSSSRRWGVKLGGNIAFDPSHKGTRVMLTFARGGHGPSEVS